MLEWHLFQRGLLDLCLGFLFLANLRRFTTIPSVSDSSVLRSLVCWGRTTRVVKHSTKRRDTETDETVYHLESPLTLLSPTVFSLFSYFERCYNVSIFPFFFLTSTSNISVSPKLCSKDSLLSTSLYSYCNGKNGNLVHHLNIRHVMFPVYSFVIGEVLSNLKFHLIIMNTECDYRFCKSR